MPYIKKVAKICFKFSMKVVEEFPFIEKIHKKEIKNFYNINTVHEYENLIRKKEI